MVGRLAERRYQLAAQKRNETALKFDYYVQAANYFERECGKAKQFNSWNVDKVKPTHWENIRKTEALHRRQSQLQDLLRAENEVYQREIDESRSRKNTREETTLEALKEKLRQKRTEQSLYHPRTCRRIQSYFSYPTKEDRELLKEINTWAPSRPSRKSLENTNLRYEMQSSESTTESPQRKKTGHVDFTNLVDQASFNVRHQEFMDNRAASNRSNFGTLPAQRFQDDKKESDKDSSGRSSAGSYERSDFLDGQQPPEGWNLPKKFAERYAKRSLQDTNVRETGGPTVKPNDTLEDVDDDGVVQTLAEDNDSQEESQDKADYIADKMQSMELHPNSVENRDHDQPWVPQSSSAMLMYLTHQEVKKKIEDLENREMKAIHKQSWEEALRLKDMKNRLELFRDKQFYLRDDIKIDPELRQLALKSIEARSKQLINREQFYVQSQMYSEEAKLMWHMWAEEDKKHYISDEKAERDLLLRQLEEEWELLQQEEKQRIFYDYMQIMNKSFSQHEMDLLAKLTKQKF
ncbi:uncharacterized protein LOC107041703 [Diachasma alloeum]|uniref:uncharacterized protein LOC107041703 n=1 Tax=Diachasma alloeum TaxID=454923 RepID=UPI0007384B9B|nr:uncharacterized protein LOC107041703 [Diachasma alloeum]